jgi:hypothetical protein
LPWRRVSSSSFFAWNPEGIKEARGQRLLKVEAESGLETGTKLDNGPAQARYCVTKSHYIEENNY